MIVKIKIRNFFHFFLIFTILESLIGCRTVRMVEQVPIHDTLHVYHMDSTHTTDSILIERQTVVREADSATLAELGVMLNDGERGLLVLQRQLERIFSMTETKKNDTVYRSVDNPVLYPVVEYKEKPLHLWQKLLMYIGIITLCCSAFWVIYRIRFKQLNR